MAAMDSDGEITLYERVQGNGVTATAHSSVFMTLYREDDTLNPMKVKCTTLDRLTASIPQIDLLKVDVEGAELAVLEGAHETLKKTKRIVVEIHGDNLDKALNMVKSLFKNVEIVPYGVQSYIVANR
jgi:FkbM family methyltransferase